MSELIAAPSDQENRFGAELKKTGGGVPAPPDCDPHAKLTPTQITRGAVATAVGARPRTFFTSQKVLLEVARRPHPVQGTSTRRLCPSC